MLANESNHSRHAIWAWSDPNKWLWPFCLSDKAKFASQVALSLTLAYLIPMAMGWPQATTAATTVMLIAATGSRRESLAMGTYRVIGTIIGAAVGLMLVGLFAQERLLYMLVVSVVVSLVFYLRNAYQQDPSVFMLTGVMILMMSNGGDANGAFIYGIDRAFMTAFGVVIFTLVSVFVFPKQEERDLKALSHKLHAAQLQLFSALTHASTLKQPSAISNQQASTLLNQVPPALLNQEPSAISNQQPSSSDIPALVKSLFACQDALEQRYASLSEHCSDIAAYKQEWDLALYYYKQITELLIFTANSAQISSATMEQGAPWRVTSLITDYQQIVDKLVGLFGEASQALELGDTAVKATKATQAQQNSATLAQQDADITLAIDIDQAQLERCSHRQKGRVFTFAYLLENLHQQLSRLTLTLACIDSVTAKVSFNETLPQAAPKFLWWDSENAKTAVKVFTTYWIAGLIWIYFNPPGGYTFVIFAVIYMSLLSFLPVHPVMLLALFTFGFIFAVPSYLFILPNLTLGIELGIFIFIYTFIAFYLFKGPVTLFFLMGLFVLGIDNTMQYNFAVLLSVMMLFYLVVLMIILSYYFPFSSKPEHLLQVMTERFLRHVSGVIASMHVPQPSWYQQQLLRWHLITMKVTVPKLALWTAKVDPKLFDKAGLIEFVSACELLSHQLILFQGASPKFAANKLVNQARVVLPPQELQRMAQALYSGIAGHQSGQERSAPSWEAGSDAASESELDVFFKRVELDIYIDADIGGFYIYLNLQRTIFSALQGCQLTYGQVNWMNLCQKRF